jgi:hypothetical protein
MTNRFSYTPASALRRFITSVLATLLVWLVLGFSMWTTVPFFLNEPRTATEAWGMLIGIWTGGLIGAVIFTQITVDNWHDYRRVLQLANHISDQASIMAGFLATYHMEMKRPPSFTFDSFAKWLDERKSLMVVHEALGLLLDLEEAEQVVIERPKTGGLIITLTKRFFERTVFAIAPDRK